MRPLEGIRVLDLSRVLAGPYCTMLLADMGAEVIKIEEPEKGDDSRGYPPFDRGVSMYYANLNRNKKSVALNLKDPQDKQTLFDLIAVSDVIVENYKPGTMEKLGFSYEAIKAANPRIILGSISGFGQYGPYRDLPGYDAIAQAMSGIMSVTGWSDSPPTRTGTAIGDVLAGLNCCIGILASLVGKRRSDRGERIDVSLVDCSVSAMETIIEIFMAEGRIPERIGNRYEFIYPYDTYPAKDGWVVIAVGSDPLWAKFCKAIGREELLADARFALNKDRVKENAALSEIVSAWSRERSIQEVLDLMHASGVPCAPINTIDKVVADPHIAVAREMIVETEHPSGGTMKIVGCPIKFSEASKASYGKAPMLGENNAEVMRKVLGR
jgi:Predicted acyl-CoA transferases/carnitine dehydratase